MNRAPSDAEPVTSSGRRPWGLAVILTLSVAVAATVRTRELEPQLDPEHGRALYERHCTVCHGPEGRGDGRAAYLLEPAPRNFASGRFRLVSTQNGVPTEGDLVATLRRGMPGSSMPPWEWLAEDDLASLARYVHRLAVEGQVADLMRWSGEEGGALTEAKARAIAVQRLTPGAAIEVGAPAPHDAATLAEGRRVYLQSCANCHGEDGTGNAPVNLSGELRNEDGTHNSARDFTRGIFKGGATHADLVRRIVAGLPGSPMPALEFAGASEDPRAGQREVAALAAYVASLIAPGAEARVLMPRRTLHVARVSGPAPVAPDDPAWAQVAPEWVALMPLWWRNERVEGVHVRAVHDGETIALHLAWRDTREDHDLLGQQSFSDAAALEFSVERDPPLFAMGGAAHAVEIAYWRAAWEADRVRAQDVGERWPDMVVDGFPDLVGDLREQSLTARAVGNSMACPARPGAAETLRAEGFGTVGPRAGAPSAWSARGLWAAGAWDVVFSRSMRAEPVGEAPLAPGLSAFLACAIWDGAARDRDGQKAVSVWHRLQLAP